MRPLAIIAALSAAALLTGCRKQEAATVKASEPPPVFAPVLAVATEPFNATVPVTGTLVSNSRVDVKAEVMGRVVRFDKEEGAPVAAGETVIWVNDENYQLTIRQSETAVRVAEAGLERARLMEAHSRSELERAKTCSNPAASRIKTSRPRSLPAATRRRR